MLQKKVFYLVCLFIASLGLTACFSNPSQEVAPTEALVSLPAKAMGNEPGWLAELNTNQLTLSLNYGQEQLVFTQLIFLESTKQQQGKQQKNSWLITANQPQQLKLTYAPATCLDSMTGMPYPWQVSLEVAGNKLQGCGGTVEEVLSGEWQIEDINNQGIIDASHITLGFDTQESRVYGSTGCNRYNSNYQLSGEGIKFYQGLSTKMACPKALMNQEIKFLTSLHKVTHLTLDNNGALILTGAAGVSLKGYKIDQ